eukprot:146520-Rhodomonas_salina.1
MCIRDRPCASPRSGSARCRPPCTACPRTMSTTRHTNVNTRTPRNVNTSHRCQHSHTNVNTHITVNTRTPRNVNSAHRRTSTAHVVACGKRRRCQSSGEGVTCLGEDDEGFGDGDGAEKHDEVRVADVRHDRDLIDHVLMGGGGLPRRRVRRRRRAGVSFGREEQREREGGGALGKRACDCMQGANEKERARKRTRETARARASKTTHKGRPEKCVPSTDPRASQRKSALSICRGPITSGCGKLTSDP